MTGETPTDIDETESLVESGHPTVVGGQPEFLRCSVGDDLGKELTTVAATGRVCPHGEERQSTGSVPRGVCAGRCTCTEVDKPPSRGAPEPSSLDDRSENVPDPDKEQQTAHVG